MADCPSLPRCVFFNDHMARISAAAESMKKRYCRDDNSQCARWLVCKAKGAPAGPADLYPNETERLDVLLA